MIDRDELQKRMEWLGDNSVESQEKRAEEDREAARMAAEEAEKERREALGIMGRLQEDIEKQEIKTAEARDAVVNAFTSPGIHARMVHDLRTEENKLRQLYERLHKVFDEQETRASE